MLTGIVSRESGTVFAVLSSTLRASQENPGQSSRCCRLPYSVLLARWHLYATRVRRPTGCGLLVLLEHLQGPPKSLTVKGILKDSDKGRCVERGVGVPIPITNFNPPFEVYIPLLDINCTFAQGLPVLCRFGIRLSTYSAEGLAALDFPCVGPLKGRI